MWSQQLKQRNSSVTLVEVSVTILWFNLFWGHGWVTTRGHLCMFDLLHVCSFQNSHVTEHQPQTPYITSLHGVSVCTIKNHPKLSTNPKWHKKMKDISINSWTMCQIMANLQPITKYDSQPNESRYSVVSEDMEQWGEGKPRSVTQISFIKNWFLSEYSVERCTLSFPQGNILKCFEKGYFGAFRAGIKSIARKQDLLSMGGSLIY